MCLSLHIRLLVGNGPPNSNKMIAAQPLVKFRGVFKQLVQLVRSKTRLAACGEAAVSLWKNTWQIRIPGTNAIGTSPLLANSRVMQPEKQGCRPAAVSIIKPRRPIVDFPVMNPPRVSGTRTHSRVAASTKRPGCTMKVEPNGT
jgi:hypothetical protein